MSLQPLGNCVALVHAGQLTRIASLASRLRETLILSGTAAHSQRERPTRSFTPLTKTGGNLPTEVFLGVPSATALFQAEHVQDAKSGELSQERSRILP